MTDKHYTQPAVAEAIVKRLVRYGDVQPGDRVLDPCVGLGAFADAIRSLGTVKQVVTVDIDRAVSADIHNDFRQVPIQGDKFDLVTSNIPFSFAQEFIEKAIGWCSPRGTIAFLLLLQFLGSNKRSGFFEQYPPSTIDVLRPRPSFAENGGTDMREYALFRWRPQDFGALRHSGPRVGFIDWSRPKRATEEETLGGRE